MEKNIQIKSITVLQRFMVYRSLSLGFFWLCCCLGVGTGFRAVGFVGTVWVKFGFQCYKASPKSPST